MLLQHGDLKSVVDNNYFDENSPCHIYFVGKRPRISIDPEKFKVDSKELEFHFKIQIQDQFINKIVRVRNDLGTSEVKMVSKYPLQRSNFMKETNCLLWQNLR